MESNQSFLMPITIPKERVYYYECSHGAFRLVMFIPHNELKNLAQNGSIKQEVLKDFPDGVDLDCIEPDFVAFQETYGYRPEHSPDLLRQSFYAMMTSSKDWQRFRGTGFIPAADLEEQLPEIDDALKNEKLRETDLPALPKDADLMQRQEMWHQRDMARSNRKRWLESYEAKSIDNAHDLLHQKFSEVKWEEGERPEEFFRKFEQATPRSQ